MKWSASRHLAVAGTEWGPANYLNLQLPTPDAPIFILQIMFNSPLNRQEGKSRSLWVSAAADRTL